MENEKGSKSLYQEILYEVRDRIATVTLNRPERLRDLAEKYLVMKPESGEQMVSLARLMIVVPEEMQVAEEEDLIEGAHLVSATSDKKQGF